MITPRGSFACAAIGDKIVVAGGGSRHTMFGAAGSRMSSVEMYDVRKDEWVALDGLPRFRAGCVGFFVGSREEREFWVMGGYGESRTISGVFPVDEYYRNAVVMDLNGGKWRELGNMWEVGDRRPVGKIVVVEVEDWDVPGIFMLDRNDIFRYDMNANRWFKETSVPRKVTDHSAVGCVALNGELHVITSLNSIDVAEGRRARNNKRSTALFLQMYHPRTKSWRSLVTKPPHPFNLKNAVLCPVQF
ncbi:hypothetical protein Leryth_005483 [Lithospermum erythrorhizon]|nr:hypothetical protein Leryth_005483 [Lithospermum erythrorhizon]